MSLDEAFHVLHCANMICQLDLERRVRTLERRQDMGVTQLREELVKAEEENGKLKRDVKYGRHFVNVLES